MKPILLLLFATILATLTAAAKDDFTLLEKQQISIETSGLFDRSDAFTVDFAALGTADYCFPLPVGKAKKLKDDYVEISTTHGDAVKAMFAGTVRISRAHPTLGNTVVVRHDNGLETVYGHNAQNLVAVGDRVKAGQTIAIVGSAGGRTYCTFAIMVNGGRINPDILISLNSHRLFRHTLLFKKKGFNVDISVTAEERNVKALAELASKANPFASGNKYTLNLANISSGEWCYPLAGAKVISAYGGRGGRRHTGVDIKTRANDDILAAFDGVVTMSQTYYGYGKCIRIKHANGLETLYSHNSKNLVKVGDYVKAGQVIALTGRTGRATTEHLHFECRINNQPFDPAKVFDHARHAIRTDKLTFTKQGNNISVKSEKGNI